MLIPVSDNFWPVNKVSNVEGWVASKMDIPSRGLIDLTNGLNPGLDCNVGWMF